MVQSNLCIFYFDFCTSILGSLVFWTVQKIMEGKRGLQGGVEEAVVSPYSPGCYIYFLPFVLTQLSHPSPLDNILSRA